jgi:hypothetical protein
LVEVICESCFEMCQGLSSVRFESGSKLARIESKAFANCSSLSSICIPSSIEVLSRGCFFQCTGLSSVAFELGSRFSSFPQECWENPDPYLAGGFDDLFG